MDQKTKPLLAAVSAVAILGGAIWAGVSGDSSLRALPVTAQSSSAPEPTELPSPAVSGRGDGSLLRVATPNLATSGIGLPTAHEEAPGEDTTVLNSPSAIPTEGIPSVEGEQGKLLSVPVKGRKTSRFGMRFHPVLHVWKLHTGLDFAAPCGTPVGAAAAGKVTRTGWAGGNGVQVKIDHGTIAGHHVETTYNHLSSIGVKVGQEVAVHQGVGRVGSTGYSTGCHLHFEVIVDGKFQDPEKWLNGEPAVDASFSAGATPQPISTPPMATTSAPVLVAPPTIQAPTTAPKSSTPAKTSAPASPSPTPSPATDEPTNPAKPKPSRSSSPAPEPHATEPPTLAPSTETASSVSEPTG